MDPRIAGEWHIPVQNAILWEKMQKWKIMLDFRLFAVKSIFTSPVFKNPGIDIKNTCNQYIQHLAMGNFISEMLDWIHYIGII